MKKTLLFLATLIMTSVVISCDKDNLYTVDSDETNNITSILIVSSNYTAGIPAIEMNDRYTYEYTYSDIDTYPTTGRFSSSYTIGVPSITIKVNSSSASLSDVTWKILKRAATFTSPTKAMEDEVAYDGTITVVRSATAPEVVTLMFSNEISNDEFFIADGFVYSVVAVQSDGSQVSSDVACLVYGKEVEVKSIMMGREVDGVVVDYEKDFTMTANTMIYDKPQLYGVLESGEVLTFEKMGFDSSQYQFDLTSYVPGEDTSTLKITPSTYEDEEVTQWEVGINSRFADYNYNEFNGHIGFEFCLSDGDGRAIDSSMRSYFYAILEKVELTSVSSATNMEKPFYIAVFNNYLKDDYLLERIMGNQYPSGSTTEYFASYFCSSYRSTITITLDGQIAQNITLYYTDVDNMKLAIDEVLADGTYEIKVVLESTMIPTVLSQTVTFTASTVK